MSRYTDFPNLFLVGAAKCGTTSVAKLLGDHQEIRLPVIKEPSPFADGYLHKTRFPNQYNALYDQYSGRFRYLLDASTPHLTSPGAAAKIHSNFPSAKIIILLRDPLLRAISLYNWMRREGYECAETFEQALAKEKERKTTFRENSPQYYRNYLYRESGLYSLQIRRYVDTFGRDNVCTIIMDDPKAKKRSAIAELESFLGISIAESEMPRLNSASGVRSARLQFSIRHHFSSPGSDVSPLPGRGIVERLAARLNRSNKPKKLSAATEESLREFYAEDVEKLEKLLGQDLCHWKKA